MSIDDEIRELGDRAGYGRMMQRAGELWNQKQPGAAFALGPCRAFMVRCPCPAWERDANGHCQVCCGSHEITERVRDMLSEMLRLRKALGEAIEEWEGWAQLRSPGIRLPHAEELRKLAAIEPGTMEPP